MRRTKKDILKKRYELNSFKEIFEHAISKSDNKIDFSECQINVSFDLGILLKTLKDSGKKSFSDKIEIERQINKLGTNIFRYTLKIPFICEDTVYKESANFKHTNFEKFIDFVGAVFESDYSFKQSVFHEKADFDMIDFESIRDQPDQSFFGTVFFKDVSFFNSHFHSLASFRLSRFIGDVNLRNTVFGNIDFSEVEIGKQTRLINYQFATFEKVFNRETGLFFKQHALERNDSISLLKFKRLEMDAHQKYLISKFIHMEIKSFRELIVLLGDLLILCFNRISNSHGNNFLKSFLFTIAAWVFFFSWYVMKRDGIGDTFIWCESEYLKEAVNYLWLFKGIDDLTKIGNLNWSLIIPFIFGKLFIAYGIYQTVSAFRKYGK